MSSDWGAHMLSTESDLYHPLQYNMGTVWPFVTGYVAWGQYRYRRPWAGFHLMDAVKQMTFDWSLGRHPELLSGTFYQPLDQTVPHQFFATSALVTPLLRGVIGWEPDAPLGRARLAPQLPPDWPEVTVRRLRAGATTTDVEFRQTWTATGGERCTTLTTTGPPLTFDFVPDVPVGAREVAIRVNGIDAELGPDGSFEVITGAGTQTGERAEIVVSWEGAAHGRAAPGFPPARPAEHRPADPRLRVRSGWLDPLRRGDGRSHLRHRVVRHPRTPDRCERRRARLGFRARSRQDRVRRGRGARHSDRPPDPPNVTSVRRRYAGECANVEPLF